MAALRSRAARGADPRSHRAHRAAGDARPVVRRHVARGQISESAARRPSARRAAARDPTARPAARRRARRGVAGRDRSIARWVGRAEETVALPCFYTDGNTRGRGAARRRDGRPPRNVLPPPRLPPVGHGRPGGKDGVLAARSSCVAGPRRRDGAHGPRSCALLRPGRRGRAASAARWYRRARADARRQLTLDCFPCCCCARCALSGEFEHADAADADRPVALSFF